MNFVTQARRRPPRGRPPRGRGRAEPPPEEDLPPEPPFWERIILSKTFRLIVGTTVGAAGLAILVFFIGPGNVSSGLGGGLGFAARQTSRLAGLGSVAVAQAIQDEGRRLWVETATPLPTPEPPPTPAPTPTPFPTPPPPRRPLAAPTPTPATQLKPGQPAKPAAPAQLPIEDAVASMREYFQILSTGDVRRAMQYWAPEAAPEARSALDAAVARGERYNVRNVQPRPLPQIGGVDISVTVDVSDSSGKSVTAEHRYQWRLVENQWYITTRLQ